MKRLTQDEFECLHRNLPDMGPTVSPDLSVNEVLFNRGLLGLVDCHCHDSEGHYETTPYGKLAMRCYLASQTWEGII